MARRLLSILCCLLLLPGLSARAVERVEDLYASVVPVEDRSAGALQRAAREGLAQVLVKVSGNQTVLEQSEVDDALGQARELVRQYSYTRLAEGDALGARVEFDPPQIRALLASAGAPLWTANRPTVLVWLVEETPEGRRFVSEESDPELVRALREGFHRRGVPARFPLLDLADTAALDPATAWQLPSSALLAAAARYGVAEVLAGRFATLGTGDRVGDWVYLSAAGRAVEGRLHSALDRVPAPVFAAVGVDLVVDTLAARYAVSASGASAGATFLQVDGVASYADYAAVVNWLQGLESVEQVDVSAVLADRLDLRLLSSADPGRLAEIIELNEDLEPVAATASASGRLHYRWRR